MKRIYKILIVLLILVVIGGIIGYSSLSKMRDTVLALEISDIDFSLVADGTYSGEYYYEEFVGASVSVTILNGEITDINIIEHITGLGSDAELIIDDVILNQSLDVDYIAGATVSSKVILKAIEDSVD